MSSVQRTACLDTSVCIDLLRSRRSVGDSSLGVVSTMALWISAITLTELVHGVSAARQPEAERARLAMLLEDLEVRAFDARAAESAGTLRARLAHTGRSIGAHDTLIGAHALSVGAALVTSNVREFQRIEGLAVYDARGR